MTTIEQRSVWAMFGAKSNDEFTAFAPTPGLLHLFGGSPESVTVTLNDDGDYFGWLTDDLTYPLHLRHGRGAYDEAMSRYGVPPHQSQGVVARFDVVVTETPRSRLSMLLDSLPPIRVALRFWQCPVPAHADRKNMVTVEWVGDIAHCTATGCPLNSENFNYATVEGMS